MITISVDPLVLFWICVYVAAGLAFASAFAISVFSFVIWAVFWPIFLILISFGPFVNWYLSKTYKED